MGECQFFYTFQAERPNQWHLSYSPREEDPFMTRKADQFRRNDDDTKKNIRLFLDHSVTIKRSSTFKRLRPSHLMRWPQPHAMQSCLYVTDRKVIRVRDEESPVRTYCAC